MTRATTSTTEPTMKASFSDITATEWIDLLIAKAAELRRAGVLEMSADRVVFAPYQEQRLIEQDDGPSAEGTEGVDAWSDPIGMGFDPGTELPSFRRKVSDDNDE